MNKQPTLEITEHGTKIWYLNGHLHREYGPAYEDIYGLKAWCFNGEYHRDNGPAVIYPSGNKEWYLNGKLYSTKEEWFQKLSPTQQDNYLWNIDE